MEILNTIWAILTKPLKVPSAHTVLHSSDHILHMTYTGLVAVEAHGMYAYAAGGLFTVAVVALLLKEPV